MIQLAWLLPLFPFIGFLINGIGNKHISKTGVKLIGCGTILASFLLSIGITTEINLGLVKSHTVGIFDWIQVGNLNIPFEFLIDPLTCVMLLIITGIGFLIHVYSTGYMHDDEGFARFFAYLNLFVFFMLLLVLGSNYVIMFIGWEGVGLCSYLLIGFWFKNHSYNNAARKAFIMNRVGDLGFLLGMFLIFQTFGSLNYSEVFTKAGGFGAGEIVLTSITILLFIGATGKSAQIPLYTWLPDAMAGPTPVSALIHAATMVTAGIYMIARSNILFTLAPATMAIIAVIGLATALLAAIIALTQNDIKKVLAYSTVSQLGYMFLALGVGAYTGAVFHLMTHAFFKALLFLGAGSVIHAMSGEQDIRKMGGLKKALPVTFLTMLAGTIAISGIPPFSGFFSKDEILAYAFQQNSIIWLLGITGALFTAFYMFRMLYLTFYGNFRGTESQRSHLHESPPSMTFPLIILAILAIFGGCANIPEALHGRSLLDNFLNPVFAGSEEHLKGLSLSHATEYMLMGISVAGVLLAIILAWSRYVKKQHVPSADGVSTSYWHQLSYNKFYVDELYNLLFVRSLNVLSGLLHRFIELSGIDALVNGTGKAVIAASRGLRFAQNGNIGYYIFAMVIGMMLIFVFNFIIF